MQAHQKKEQTLLTSNTAPLEKEIAFRFFIIITLAMHKIKLFCIVIHFFLVNIRCHTPKWEFLLIFLFSLFHMLVPAFEPLADKKQNPPENTFSSCDFLCIET